MCLGPAPATWSPSLCAGTDIYRQFGLCHPLVVQLLEQLPNSEKCSGYRFTYHHPEKLSSWQATVSSFMTCPSSLCFTYLLFFIPSPYFPSWPSHPSLFFLLPPPSSLLPPSFLPPPFSFPPSFFPFREQHSTPVAVLGLSHFVGKSP